MSVRKGVGFQNTSVLIYSRHGRRRVSDHRRSLEERQPSTHHSCWHGSVHDPQGYSYRCPLFSYPHWRVPVTGCSPASIRKSSCPILLNFQMWRLGHVIRSRDGALHLEAPSTLGRVTGDFILESNSICHLLREMQRVGFRWYRVNGRTLGHSTRIHHGDVTIANDNHLSVRDGF